MTSWDTVRVALHLVGVSVWVGGQLTLAFLVPALRAVSVEAPRAAARAFNRVAWPAFGLLVLTGAWNLAAGRDKDGRFDDPLVLTKLVAVGFSGAAAYLHTKATQPRARGVYGGLSAFSAVAALVLGVRLSE